MSVLWRMSYTDTDHLYCYTPSPDQGQTTEHLIHHSHILQYRYVCRLRMNKKSNSVYNYPSLSVPDLCNEKRLTNNHNKSFDLLIGDFEPISWNFKLYEHVYNIDKELILPISISLTVLGIKKKIIATTYLLMLFGIQSNKCSKNVNSYTYLYRQCFRLQRCQSSIHCNKAHSEYHRNYLHIPHILLRTVWSYIHMSLNYRYSHILQNTE